MFSYSLNRYKEHMPASNQDLDSAREKMFDARRHSDSVARTIPQHTFAYAQRAVNPYELVQHLDNGENMWPRSFYTILELAALFPAIRTAATAKTLHLCEAPGYFCDAVLRLSDGQADWHACSLSNRGMLFQKHLLLAKKSNGHSRVVFGERGTGDLQEKDTAMCIVYECGGNVSLVTADGADDEVQDQWSLTNVKLLAAQMFTALNALEKGDALCCGLITCSNPVTSSTSGHASRRLPTSPLSSQRPPRSTCPQCTPSARGTRRTRRQPS